VPFLTIYLACRSPYVDLSHSRHGAFLEAFSNRTAQAMVLAVVIAISFFAVLEKYTVICAITALLATFFATAIFHDLTKDEDGTMSTMRLEDVLESLSWKIVSVVAGAFIIQFVVYGSIEMVIGTVVSRAVIKVLFWICLSKMVSSAIKNRNI
jgi:hypothetical protein